MNARKQGGAGGSVLKYVTDGNDEADAAVAAHTRKNKKSRRLSTLPHSHPCSTIDAKELNYRVRDGIGCGLFAIITGKIVEESFLI